MMQHGGDTSNTSPSISLIQEAHVTLSDPALRAAHDESLSAGSGLASSVRGGQRPAEVVSLEEFEEDGAVWTHPCRCGASYSIGEDQLEKDVHLIGCQGCSEVVWVGYEALEE